MKKILALAALVTSLSAAQAQQFIAMLDGAQDGGGNRTGSGIINLTLTGNTFTFSGFFSGLSGIVNNGGFHIHAPAVAGQNASVLYGLFPSMTLDADRKGGTINGSQTLTEGQLGFTIAQQVAQLNNREWYFNIHTSTFGGGEIRGQILPVPEPSTLALTVLGLGGLLVWRVRRRKV